MKNRNTVLITGASAGIGEQLARVFAGNGCDLVLVARRKSKLRSLAGRLRKAHGVKVKVHPADLAVDGAAAALCAAFADKRVDILVNNAGVLSSGSFRRMSPAAIDNMIRVNVVALTGLCRGFAKPMVERGSGRILNVASIAAFQAVPSLAVYAATKAYVLSLGEALAVELDGKGVSVTTVCPGFTETDMLSGASDGASGTSAIPEAIVLQPDRVALEAYDACMAGDTIRVPGTGYALAMATTRLLPRWVLRAAGSLALRSGRRGQGNSD